MNARAGLVVEIRQGSGGLGLRRAASLIRFPPVDEALAPGHKTSPALLCTRRDDITDLAWAEQKTRVPGWVRPSLPAPAWSPLLALRPRGTRGDMDHLGGGLAYPGLAHRGHRTRPRWRFFPQAADANLSGGSGDPAA